MIDRSGVEQILAQYAKHGWTLRRVLLSQRLRESAPDIVGLFGPIEIKTADLEGLWFSRSSRPGVTAWELRRLSENPFALITAVEDGDDEAAAEAKLKETESRMIENVRRANGSSAH